MSPGTKLVAALQTLCVQHGLPWNDQLSDDLPRKWRIHGDMLLLPSSRCFRDHQWTDHIRSFIPSKKIPRPLMQRVIYCSIGPILDVCCSGVWTVDQTYCFRRRDQ